MNAFMDFYKATHTRLEGNIVKWMTAQSGNQNSIIQEGFNRLSQMNREGKRLRGTLAYLGYHVMGNDNLDVADALAESFELFQTAILIHDDIIDHASSRRNMETIHTAYFREFMENTFASQDEASAMETGRAIALCLGDMGLFLAEERLVSGYGGHPQLSRLLSYYHKMVLYTIEGELLDVQLSYIERGGLWEKVRQAQTTPLETIIYDIYHLKTACYTTIGPLCSGMLLGGASPELLRQMEDVADAMGVAFQIQDDVLGIYGNSQGLGKNIGSDISEYKQTLLYSFVKNQGGTAYEHIQQYYGKPKITDSDLKAVQRIFRETGALEAANRTMVKLFTSACEKLDQIKDIPDEKKELIYGFMNYLQTREN